MEEVASSASFFSPNSNTVLSRARSATGLSYRNKFLSFIPNGEVGCFLTRDSFLRPDIALTAESLQSVPQQNISLRMRGTGPLCWNHASKLPHFRFQLQVSAHGQNTTLSSLPVFSLLDVLLVLHHCGSTAFLRWLTNIKSIFFFFVVLYPPVICSRSGRYTNARHGNGFIHTTVNVLYTHHLTCNVFLLFFYYS